MSGRKNVLEAFAILDEVDISTNQVQLVPTYIKNLDKASILVEWSGTSPVGTLTVEVRNIREPVGAVSDWTTLDMGSAISISGNTGSHTLIFNELPFTQLRLNYAASSGIGTLSAIMLSKTVGA